MKWAQVVDGIVVNVIVWDGDGDLALPGELVDVTDVACGPGWSYVDGEFVGPVDSDSVA